MPFGTVKLNDGSEMPAIAFGTGSTMKFKDVTAYVEQALENGFSHIDTARFYMTEKYILKAIREEGLQREQLYLTTKYDGGFVRREIEGSLDRLGMKSVDLYLVHNPRLVNKFGEDTWFEMEKLKKDGLSKSIGVSNYKLSDLKQLLSTANVKPSVNQISLHPYNWAELKKLVEFSTEQGIVTEAYGSLAPITQFPGGPVDPVLRSIGDRIGGTPAQVIFKWLQSKGIVIVTTTTKVERLKEYLGTAELPDLTKADIDEIEKAGAKGPPMFKTPVLRWMVVFIFSPYFDPLGEGVLNRMTSD